MYNLFVLHNLVGTVVLSPVFYHIESDKAPYKREGTGHTIHKWNINKQNEVSVAEFSH